jgi:hypothetical protein
MHDDSFSARDVLRGKLSGLPHTTLLSVGVSRYQAAVEILERDVVGNERRRIVVRFVEADDATKALVTER